MSKKQQPRWKELNQYYTNKDVAEYCFKTALKKLEDFTGRSRNDVWFVEPAAGEGAFYNCMPEDRRLGIDIDPKIEGVIKDDFLTREIPDKDKIYWQFTNPPFGYRLKTAREFFNRSCLFCEAIVFVAPHSFCRYQNANRLLKTHRLIHQEGLDADSFHTPAGNKYKIPAELSVWVKTNRAPVIQKPLNSHPDFQLSLYRVDRREQTLHLIDEDWDIAIKSGYHNKENGFKFDKKDLDLEANWIFVKCHKKETKQRMLDLDTDAIANNNMSGNVFRQDIIKEYTKLYGDGSYDVSKPKTSHPDFEILDTDERGKESESRWNSKWQVAIKQCYYKNNHGLKFNKNDCDISKRYMLIVSNLADIKERFGKIDWQEVSNKCAHGSIMKHHIVDAYTKLYGDGSYTINKQRTSHPDFSITQYHNTRKNIEVFDEPFDFVFKSTNFGDDVRIEYNKEYCEKNCVWNIVRCKNDKVKQRLLNINWKDYSSKTPGRSMIIINDVYDIYTKLYGDGSYVPQKPIISHNDFSLMLYSPENKQSHKHWQTDWDFAIRRAWFKKSTGVAYKESDCDKKKEWYLIKTNKDNVKDKFLSIDWEKVSKDSVGDVLTKERIVSAYESNIS